MAVLKPGPGMPESSALDEPSCTTSWVVGLNKSPNDMAQPYCDNIAINRVAAIAAKWRRKSEWARTTSQPHGSSNLLEPSTTRLLVTQQYFESRLIHYLLNLDKTEEGKRNDPHRRTAKPN